MQIEQKDGKIHFFFEKEAKTEQEEEAQKKAIFSAVEEIQKMKKIEKKIDWKFTIIACLFFCTALGFHYYSKKIENKPQYIQQIQNENLEIEQDIEKQILNRKAEELGFQKLHENNPDIVDYLNLYILPQTALYELETEKTTIYKGVPFSTPALKLRDGKTVFELQKQKYYIKD